MHLYFGLPSAVDTEAIHEGDTEDGPGSSPAPPQCNFSSYETLCARLGRVINGEPTGYDDSGKPLFHCPQADANVYRLAATLRPPGSYNHGKNKGDEPFPVKLAFYYPNAKMADYESWVSGTGSGVRLPFLSAPLSRSLPEEYRKRKEMEEEGLHPFERRNIPARTRMFLSSGPEGHKSEHHDKVITTATDLAWACYTQEEALDLLLKHVSRSRDDEAKYRHIIYSSPGRKFKWNTTPCGIMPDLDSFGW